MFQKIRSILLTILGKMDKMLWVEIRIMPCARSPSDTVLMEMQDSLNQQQNSKSYYLKSLNILY